MNVSSQPEPDAMTLQQPGSPANRPSGRSRLRLATVGGIAAIAILGGGIAAAASAGAPARGAGVDGQAVAAATGMAAPPAPKVHRPHLDGTVTSVSGSTVLIKDHEGFTRTIVTSSTTTYRDDLTASPAVGTKIHAEGTVASNGTSLEAAVIGADNGPPAGGPGGKGPGGPMGPNGKHAGPRNGADAPVPPAPGGTNAAPTAPSDGTDAPAAPSDSSTAPSTMATTKWRQTSPGQPRM